MDENIVRHLEQKNAVAEILRRAKALIGTPERHRRNDAGDGVLTRCSLHALVSAGEFNFYGPAHALLRQAAGTAGILSINSKGHAATMLMFDRAIALAEQQ